MDRRGRCDAVTGRNPLVRGSGKWLRDEEAVAANPTTRLSELAVATDVATGAATGG